MIAQCRAGVLLAAAFATALAAADTAIVVQSTTSTQNSGLSAALGPQIAADTGVQLRVVAVGTGQAINNARRCDGDLLWVHAKAAEEQFVADGFGVKRFDVMYNDFVLVGPGADPAGVGGGADILAALAAIRDAGALFVSRGDDSGTHKKERALWAAIGAEPAADSDWYRETGSGMGATLNLATALGAYTLSDRASWVSFANRGRQRVLVEGDERLFNQYGIVRVSAARCPAVKVEAAQAVIDWVLSERGQAAIDAYRVDGQQLFHANAR